MVFQLRRVRVDQSPAEMPTRLLCIFSVPLFFFFADHTSWQWQSWDADILSERIFASILKHEHLYFKLNPTLSFTLYCFRLHLCCIYSHKQSQQQNNLYPKIFFFYSLRNVGKRDKRTNPPPAETADFYSITDAAPEINPLMARSQCTSKLYCIHDPQKEIQGGKKKVPLLTGLHHMCWIYT